MPTLFISHASDDRALIDDVKTMLQSAIGLAPEDIFYSSDKGTGIPAGSNFADYIKTKMRESTFVVAVITPAYLESEFCIAELGAVWALADKDFFPLCVPDVSRSDLRATLTGIQVERIDEGEPLSELLQRVAEHFGHRYNAPAGTKAINVLLAILDQKLKALRGPTRVPVEKLDEAREALDALAEQLASTQGELKKERERYTALEAAKTQEERELIRLPADEVEKVEHLIGEARYAVGKLKPAVKRVIPFHLRGYEGMPWPTDKWEHEELSDAVDDGRLKDGGDNALYLNDEWPDVGAAIVATEELQQALGALTEEGRKWFLDRYEVPPDMSQTAAFKEVLL
jgi:hypothetical protein